MGEEYTHSVNFLKTAFGSDEVKVAVSAYSPKGDVRIVAFKAVGVPHAVAKMNDKTGLRLFHGAEHIVFVGVRVAHNEYFHGRHLLSVG